MYVLTEMSIHSFIYVMCHIILTPEKSTQDFAHKKLSHISFKVFIS